MAVIAVATGVTRAELVLLRQERDETFRAFSARVRGKAETCAYSVNCTCGRDVDFTDAIVRDVLIAGISDLDIRREVLGTVDIIDQPVNDVIALVESKETARNALPLSAAGISTFKRDKRLLIPKVEAMARPTSRGQTASCPACRVTYSLYSEGVSGWNTRPHKLCLDCYRCQRRRRGTAARTVQGATHPQEIDAVLAQVSPMSYMGAPARSKRRRRTRRNRSRTTVAALQKSVSLRHHIFTAGEWREARVMGHPVVRLSASVSATDYRQFNRRCPAVHPTNISALVDSGAQSCLWSLQDFLAAGFTTEDLIPVSLDLIAANKSPIDIAGAVMLRLSGTSTLGAQVSCASMVYISAAAKGFYLSCESMIDLGIIPPNFPSVGSAQGHSTRASLPPAVASRRRRGLRLLNAGCSSAPEGAPGPCSCPPRTVVPERPSALPFSCIPENNAKMKDWLMDRFASSTFNTCPHRPLPCMSGPPIEIHLNDDATPKAVHTPAAIPLHWQAQVQADLLRDEALGVIERVPYGEPVVWCHRMVTTRKHDGTPRRTVDLSPLNRHCKRETFASESPFQLARKVPGNTWKTVCDAWNGYHSVPLREADRHFTTFITPFGRWRYTRAPQGFVSSGDGYNRRFDEILADFPRKERCVDDVVHYDDSLENHWWRTMELLARLGRSGIVLNPAKFRFAQRSVEFAGFRLSESSIEPLPKYLDAIRHLPTPNSTTDVRSWFGLVNQVSNYAQLRDLMRPFKPFLSPKHQFEWNAELDEVFQASKLAIVDAIKTGVEIFDPSRRTCLRPDWSRLGIGYYLSQKFCLCSSGIPGCCENGWRITLAGSRFLNSAEERHAPVEGEALAVAWGLEQSKYFTQGCNDLLVVTDHKPLVKILGDRTLDEIDNSRIFRLKQRTLPWDFTIVYLPGKSNATADATSRHPSQNDYVELASRRMHSESDDAESALVAAIRRDTETFMALSWERLASEMSADPDMKLLLKVVEQGFPEDQKTANNAVASFWPHRRSLYVAEGVVMFQDRVVIPPSLRGEVLHTLHSAHHGIPRSCHHILARDHSVHPRDA